jgi:hypothetical protein
MLLKQALDGIGIAQIPDNQWNIGGNRLAMALIQAVEDNAFVAGCEQFCGTNAADIASTACDQYFHVISFSCSSD